VNRGHDRISFSLCRLGQRAGISPTKESQRWTQHRAPPGKPARSPAPLLSNPTIALLATEEVGGRGFVVPELARGTSFHRVAPISRGIWAAWHAPLIAFANYNAGAPAWYSVACFSATVVSVGGVSAWLRWRSGSLWAAVLLHASHNAFMQAFFPHRRRPAPRRDRVRLGPHAGLVCCRGVSLAEAANWRSRDTEQEHVTVTGRRPSRIHCQSHAVPGLESSQPACTDLSAGGRCARAGVARCLTRRVASIVMSAKVTHQMLWLQCRKPMIAV
jgi:CAAX prenyl protease-like protein